jgi:hypothetical protein
MRLFACGIARPIFEQPFNLDRSAVFSQERKAQSQVDRRETHGWEFQLKQQRFGWAPLALAVALASTASPAVAQSGGQWRLPVQAIVRTGIQKPPPAPPTTIVIVTPTVFPQQLYYYDPVMRPCISLHTSTRVVAGNGRVISRPSQIDSERNLPSRNLPSANGTTIVTTTPARPACYVKDAYGRVHVYRY